MIALLWFFVGLGAGFALFGWMYFEMLDDIRKRERR
jgi:H+/Cl- antiporter ClcA